MFKCGGLKLVAVLATAYLFTQGCPVLPAALTEIAVDFDVAPMALGGVVSVYSAVLGISFLFVGVVADSVSRSTMIFAGAAGTALTFVLCACAGNFWAFGLVFALMGGMTQSFFYPSASSLLSECCPRHFSTALATLQVMLYVGSLFAAMLGGACADAGDGHWRMAFLVFGVGGLLFSVYVSRTLRSFGKDVSTGCPRQKLLDTLRSVFSCRIAFSHLLLAFGFTTAMDFGVRTWGPMFLGAVSGAGSCVSATIVLLCLNVGAGGGAVLGGLLADRMIVRCPYIRPLIASVALLVIVPPLFVFSRMESLIGAGVCLVVVGVGRGVLDVSLFASVLEHLPTRMRSSAMGLFMGLSYVFGAFSPALVGGIFHAAGFRQGMAAIAAFPLLAAVFAARAVFVERRFVIIPDQK